MSVFSNPITSTSWQPSPSDSETAAQPDHYYACQCGECAAAFVNIHFKTSDPSTAPATISSEATAQAAALPYYVSALLYPQDWRWNADSKHGTAITVTYSFMASNPGTYGGFRTFSEAEKTAARRALDEWADVSNISFSEVSSGGQIKFGNADLGGASGMALWKGMSGKYSGMKTTSSDVYLNSKMALTYDDGSFGYRAMLHEIGHALGLKHSFDTVGTTVSGVENTGQYTVMSYANPPSTPQVQPHTAQLYDIAAAQHLYGANMSHNSGNTVYQLSNTKTQVMTIWDGGGIDTIDASNQTRAATIDLREGKFSSIGTYNNGAAKDNVAIAYNAVIERAIGGSGSDRITGNAANNVLIGGLGADILTGGSGADIFAWRSASEGGDTVTDFTSGVDRMEFVANAFGLSAGILDTTRFVTLSNTYSGGNGTGSEWNASRPTFIFDSSGNLYWDGNGAGTGYTKVASVTGTVNASDIHLVDQITGPGVTNSPTPQPTPTPTPTPTPEPTPTPTPVATTVNGTSGNDTLDGRGGEKTMVGGLGNDIYIVDSVGDKVVEYSSQGVDTVYSSLSYRLGQYAENLTLTGSDSINGIGSAWHNFMRGNESNNVLRGLAGNDTIDGKGGNDILIGGSGKDTLTGGAGADIFLYQGTGDISWARYNATKGSVKADTLTDFQNGVDKIAFQNFALTNGSAVDGVNFAKIGSAYNGTNAYGSEWSKGNASLIFDSTGSLYYDPNGKGSGYYVVAQLQPGANVHASDIIIA